MEYAHIFVSVMLICFASAWPTSIYKSYISRNNQGKSIFFLYLILFGYVSGIISQYLESSVVSYVFYIFFINLALVFTDILLYYRNKYLIKK